MAAWYSANKEHVIARNAKYVSENPDKARAWGRNWARKNQPRCADQMRDWRNNNRERAREHVRSRRRKAQPLDPALILGRYEVFGNRCAYCGSASKLEADHVIPMAKGGKHIAANIRPACRRCNASKAARKLSDWLADPERLMGADVPSL